MTEPRANEMNRRQLIGGLAAMFPMGITAEALASRLASMTDEQKAEIDALLEGVGEKGSDFDSWLQKVSPKWNWHWAHLAKIREHLERITDGRNSRLMIFQPPRSGKSEMTTIRYPVWRMEREPDTRVCVGCYNQRFAERFGRRSRRLAETRGIVSKERAASMEWETKEVGVYRACGVGSPPMGEGFSLLIIDDPTKSREEAESDVYRERAWEWYGDLYTRLEPGAAMVLISTRWHEDDLPGRLMTEMSAGGEQWEILNLPAIAEENDPIGRKPGQPLCPDRYTLADLNRIRATLGEYAWQALYQGQPTPREGALFKVDKLEHVDRAPEDIVEKVRAWDLAATAGGGDYSVGVLMGRNTAGRFFVLDVVRGQWGPEDRNQVMLITAQRDGANVRIAQDPGQAGKEQARQLTAMLAGSVVKSERVTGAKVTRADPFASQVNGGNVGVLKADWNRAYIEELRRFPMGKNDDQVDASSDAFAEIANSAPWEFF